mmetsp:Transcript_849/g.1687  ORF Transcript_849/g.1687 Transcript_849/m.1687 type:complete len:265 (+) Transcript_849:207-1001(+)
MMQVAEVELSVCGPRQVATLCHAAGRLARQEELKASAISLLRAAGAEIGRCEEDLQPQGVANWCWAYGKVQVGLPVAERLAARATTAPGQYAPQQIAAVVWSLAALRSQRRDLLRALGLEAAGIAGQFADRSLTNVLWAYSCVNVHHESVEWLVEEAGLRSRRLRTDDLIGSLVSTAKLRVGSIGAALLCKEVGRRGGIPARWVGTGCWALAELGNRDALASVARRIEPQSLTPAEVASLAVAYSRWWDASHAGAAEECRATCV